MILTKGDTEYQDMYIVGNSIPSITNLFLFRSYRVCIIQYTMTSKMEMVVSEQRASRAIHVSII